VLVALMAFSCAGAGISGSNKPGDTGDGKAISYDEARLYKGNVVIFDSKITNAQKYAWSYKKRDDKEYTPLPHFDRSRMSLAFIEPGDYSIKLVTNDTATDSTSIEITIRDRVIDINEITIDPDKFIGLMKFKRKDLDTEGIYTSSLRLNDKIMEFIRDNDDYNMTFTIAIDGYSKNTIENFDIRESVVQECAPPSPFTAIANQKTNATDFPKIIWERELRLDPFTDGQSIREISRIDYQAIFGIRVALDTLSTDIKGFDPTYITMYLVIPQNPPDEFYLMY